MHYSQRELLTWARGQLSGLEGASAATEARTLLEWALGVENLWAAPDAVGAHAAERFRSGVAQRRARIPLQHVVGRMWFRGLTLAAEPGVFICRPETEVVAGTAIDEAKARVALSGAAVVVDLCAGSGAIALAVAAEVPTAQVDAVELSPRAFDLARRNNQAVADGRVRLHRGDATDPAMLAELDGTVDVVVSNPPYIPLSTPVTQREAGCDPEEALYGGGEDGMVVPRGIITRAAALLVPGGLLVMEHAEVQAEQCRAAAASADFVDISTGQDLTGRDRFLVARRSRN